MLRGNDIVEIKSEDYWNLDLTFYPVFGAYCMSIIERFNHPNLKALSQIRDDAKRTNNSYDINEIYLCKDDIIFRELMFGYSSEFKEEYGEKVQAQVKLFGQDLILKKDDLLVIEVLTTLTEASLKKIEKKAADGNYSQLLDIAHQKNGIQNKMSSIYVVIISNGADKFFQSLLETCEVEVGVTRCLIAGYMYLDSAAMEAKEGKLHISNLIMSKKQLEKEIGEYKAQLSGFQSLASSQIREIREIREEPLQKELREQKEHQIREEPAYREEQEQRVQREQLEDNPLDKQYDTFEL